MSLFSETDRTSDKFYIIWVFTWVWVFCIVHGENMHLCQYSPSWVHLDYKRQYFLAGILYGGKPTTPLTGKRSEKDDTRQACQCGLGNEYLLDTILERLSYPLKSIQLVFWLFCAVERDYKTSKMLSLLRKELASFWSVYHTIRFHTT